MQVVLVMFRSDGERRSFSVVRNMTVIGRREDCDLRIPVGDVSRKHCRLVRTDDGIRIEDLGSSNGTYVNGQRVQESELNPGDNIGVGPVQFIVQINGVPDEEEMLPPGSQPPAIQSEDTAVSEVHTDDLEEIPFDEEEVPASAPQLAETLEDVTIDESPHDEAAIEGSSVDAFALDDDSIDGTPLHGNALDEAPVDETPVDEPLTSEHSLDEVSLEEAPLDEITSDEVREDDNAPLEELEPAAATEPLEELEEVSLDDTGDAPAPVPASVSLRPSTPPPPPPLPPPLPAYPAATERPAAPAPLSAPPAAAEAAEDADWDFVIEETESDRSHTDFEVDLDTPHK